MGLDHASLRNARRGSDENPPFDRLRSLGSCFLSPDRGRVGPQEWALQIKDRVDQLEGPLSRSGPDAKVFESGSEVIGHLDAVGEVQPFELTEQSIKLRKPTPALGALQCVAYHDR